MPRIIVFDVNETLLDVGALEPHFARAFGEGRALQEWFSLLLLYSEVVTLTGLYRDFASIAGAALEMLAESRGQRLAADDRGRILDGVLSLPPHPDVVPALGQLRDAGLRLVTLTNSSLQAAHHQLEHAGLTDYFERVFSVDPVRRFKPAPEPYQFVAKELGVETNRLRLVAAHGWDVVGALQAGCAAAFVARPRKTLYPLGPVPDIIAGDLTAVAAKIVVVESAGR